MDSFINLIKTAAFGFAEIWEAILGLWNNGGIKDMFAELVGKVNGLAAYVPYVWIVLGLLIALFGKKLFPVLRFVAFFLAGYTVGMALLLPKLAFVPAEFGWAVGVVIGLVVAILAKFLFWLAYIVAAGYSVYIIAYTGMFFKLPFEGDMLMIVSAVAAVVAIVLALLLRHPIISLGTAFLGGYMVAVNVNDALFPFAEQLTFLPLEPAKVLLLAAGVVALIGAIVQFATRRRR